jgi:hypothetical protein
MSVVVALDYDNPDDDPSVLGISAGGVSGASDEPSSPIAPDVAISSDTPEISQPGTSVVANSPSAHDVAKLLAHAPHLGPMSSMISKSAPNSLELSEADLRRLEAAAQPDWQPPATEIVLRPLTEKLQRYAQVVNLLHKSGKKSITAKQVGNLLVQLGWKFVKANNGVGDALGEGGLQLERFAITGGHAYKVPQPDGITEAYLRSKRFDV